MATHNIVVFGGDHCGPEVCAYRASGFNWYGTSKKTNCALA